MLKNILIGFLYKLVFDKLISFGHFNQVLNTIITIYFMYLITNI